MAKVDFYILPGAGEDNRQQFACRLAEKAYKLDNRVHIHVPDGENARRVDDLLWTFSDGSFVPHEILEHAGNVPASPVTIGCNEMPGNNYDLLINLCDIVPDAAGSFPRVAEVVTSDDECKTASRRRFVAYRDQGHTLETHNL